MLRLVRWIVIATLMVALSQSATAQSIQVNCGAGDTLAQALGTAQPGMVIQVAGTCQERVTVTTDRVTIDGQGSAIIDGGGEFPIEPALAGVITIDGASGVRIMGLTVQNGPDGILILRGASATLTDVTSQNNADEGLQVTRGSTATFGGTIISQNNGDDGISVLFTSSLLIAGGSTVSSLNNGGDGISIFSSSSFRSSQSILQLDQNGRLEPGGDGLKIVGTSTASLAFNTNLTANQNARRGITLSSASYLAVTEMSAVTVMNNGDDGLGIFSLSRFFLGSGSPLRSESNADTGINVSSIAIASCSTQSTVTLLNNTIAPSFVSLNSQATPSCLESNVSLPLERQHVLPPSSEVDQSESN